MQFTKYHWLLIGLAFVFLGISIYYPIAYYDALPDKIATHFNAQGVPDSWSNKSLLNLLLGPIVVVPTLLIMVPIVWWITKVSDPREIINGPREKVQNMSTERAEEVRRTVVFHMLFINLLVALLIMMISIKTVSVSIGQQATLGLGVPLSVALLIGDSIFLTWRIMRLVYKS